MKRIGITTTERVERIKEIQGYVECVLQKLDLTGIKDNEVSLEAEKHPNGVPGECLISVRWPDRIERWELSQDKSDWVMRDKDILQ